MKESIIPLAEHLVKTGDRFNNHLFSSDKTSMSPWGMVWMLMIGACYSLLKAEQFLSASREPQNQIDDAKNILNQIPANADSIDEKACGSWVVGYYLYSAEQRISSALHRLLKAYQNKDKSAFELTKEILKQCPVCKRQPGNACLPLSEPILRKFNFENYDILRKNRVHFYSDMSAGGCLNRVWFRVNDIKHYQFEESNPEDPEKRWQDAISVLEGLLIIFKDFASHKGYHTSSK